MTLILSMSAGLFGIEEQQAGTPNTDKIKYYNDQLKYLQALKDVLVGKKLDEQKLSNGDKKILQGSYLVMSTDQAKIEKERLFLCELRINACKDAIKDIQGKVKKTEFWSLDVSNRPSWALIVDGMISLGALTVATGGIMAMGEDRFLHKTIGGLILLPSAAILLLAGGLVMLGCKEQGKFPYNFVIGEKCGSESNPRIAGVRPKIKSDFMYYDGPVVFCYKYNFCYEYEMKKLESLCDITKLWENVLSII